MKRLAKTVYCDDNNRELVELKDGKAGLLRPYHNYTADDLEQLSLACEAAAEELRAIAAPEPGLPK